MAGSGASLGDPWGKGPEQVGLALPSLPAIPVHPCGESEAGRAREIFWSFLLWDP